MTSLSELLGDAMMARVLDGLMSQTITGVELDRDGLGELADAISIDNDGTVRVGSARVGRVDFLSLIRAAMVASVVATKH